MKNIADKSHGLQKKLFTEKKLWNYILHTHGVTCDLSR